MPTRGTAPRRYPREEPTAPFVLAMDYDGTLADDGKVARDTIAALRRWMKTGRRLILVTGRELEDLLHVFPLVELFDVVVAENGALLYWPHPQPPREHPLARPPPREFAQALRARGVEPVSIGRIVVATWEPHQQAVLDTIRDLGLELEVIFNKGAVMVLPSGINKASGLRAALEELEIPPVDVVGVGDGENDHSLLDACGIGVAVANAVPALKKHADIVLEHARGAGIIELIDRILMDAVNAVRPGEALVSHDKLPKARRSSPRLP